MNISTNGINLIKKYEGCSLTAYLCPANVWTIGWGTTEPINGVKIHKGMTITQKQADDLLLANLKSYERAVNKLGVVFNQNQFDALVSFCYNLGTGIFTGNLLQAIQTKNWNSVASQMKLYNKARVNGVLTELKGLTKRRNEESALFLLPVEEVEKMKEIKVLINGKEVKVQAIEKDGNNYIKLRDLASDKITIDYDATRKMPTVTTK